MCVFLIYLDVMFSWLLHLTYMAPRKMQQRGSAVFMSCPSLAILVCRVKCYFPLTTDFHGTEDAFLFPFMGSVFYRLMKLSKLERAGHAKMAARQALCQKPTPSFFLGLE